MGDKKAAAVDTPGELSSEARDLLERAGLRQEPPAKETARGEEAADKSKAPTELEVDIGGGVKRTVKIADLTQAFLEKGNLQQVKQALDQQLAELGDAKAIKALQQRILSLPDGRRQRIFNLLGDESEVDDTEVDDTDDDDDDMGLLPPSRVAKKNGEAREAQLPRELLAKIGQMEKVLEVLAQREGQRIETTKRATTREQVQALMGTIDVFTHKKHAAAAKLAEDSIVMQLTADPQLTVEQAVHRNAQRLQQLISDTRQEVADDVRASPPQLPAIKGGYGRALMKGDLRRAAQNALRSQPD